MTLTTQDNRNHPGDPAPWGDAREDGYVHLAAQVDLDPASAPPRATESLRDAITDLQVPLAGLTGCASVISARLFRAARLPQIESGHAWNAQRDVLARHDLAIFVRLTSSARVEEFLDSRAFRQVLDVLQARGRDIMITPARNVGAISDEPGRNRLSLIQHVLAHDADRDENSQWDAGRFAKALELTEREVLLPLDPDSTPFRVISRADLDAVRTRKLAVALIRGTPNEDLTCWADAAIVIPHLYWELPVHGSTFTSSSKHITKNARASEEAQYERFRRNPHAEPA
jgi:hypothetical protein